MIMSDKLNDMTKPGKTAVIKECEQAVYDSAKAYCSKRYSNIDIRQGMMRAGSVLCEKRRKIMNQERKMTPEVIEQLQKILFISGRDIVWCVVAAIVLTGIVVVIGLSAGLKW